MVFLDLLRSVGLHHLCQFTSDVNLNLLSFLDPREREKLRIEREKIERERAELLRLEREAQKLERERLQREKEELKRAAAK